MTAAIIWLLFQLMRSSSVLGLPSSMNVRSVKYTPASLRWRLGLGG